jgi:hypothetical protein
MHNLVRVAAAAAALSLAAPAVAQPAQPQARDNKFGIGIGIVPIDAAGQAGTVEVYFPIALAPNFRLEPSIGLFTVDAPSGGTDHRDLTLGVGAFAVNRLAPQVDMYFGGRLKLNFAKSDGPTVDDSDTDLFLAAAVGGEYYFVPKFSLGLEAQLGLYSHGDVRGDDSGLFTSGVAFLRVYF